MTDARDEYISQLIADNTRLRARVEELESQDEERRTVARERQRDRRSRDSHASETPVSHASVTPQSRDSHASPRGSLEPSSLPNQPSLQEVSNNLTLSSLALSPQPGTSPAPLNNTVSVRPTMDLTTIVNGRPATPLEPAPPDFGITEEASSLTNVADLKPMSQQMKRKVKREVTRLLTTYPPEQVRQGLESWDKYDQNLYAGKIEYWVRLAGRPAPKLAKEIRLENLLAKKDGTSRKGIAQ